MATNNEGVWVVSRYIVFHKKQKVSKNAKKRHNVNGNVLKVTLTESASQFLNDIQGRLFWYTWRHGPGRNKYSRDHKEKFSALIHKAVTSYFSILDMIRQANTCCYANIPKLITRVVNDPLRKSGQVSMISNFEVQNLVNVNLNF